MSKANITVTVPSHYSTSPSLESADDLPEGLTMRRLDSGDVEVSGDSADVSNFIMEVCLDDEDSWGAIMDTAR